jgi:hypothetical protein
VNKPDRYFGRTAYLRTAIAAVASVAVVAVLMLAVRADWGARESIASDGGLTVTLAVEPFEVGDSVPGSWDSAGFAESLATRLSLAPGIQATANAAGAHYVLRGKVAMKDGRLILATRLGRNAERDTVWTATFWRSAASGATLLSDLAAAVAEAAINETVRETLTPKREKP